MPSKAPRLPARLRRRRVRGAMLVLSVWLAGAGPASAADTVISARFTDPTSRYAHGVLGDDIEYGGLEMTVEDTSSTKIRQLDLVYRRTVQAVRLLLDRVFEDITPRIVDIDQDGSNEVVVVESSVHDGAQLAIYNARGEKIAATPHIGTRFRWLAPIGAADLDGDGFVEVAYIDRPHLAKTLRIWRFKEGDLTEVTALPGLTNHRIGENFITGGVRECGTSPELIVVSANWQRIISVSYDQDWITQSLSPFTRAAMKRILNCSY